MWSKLLNVGVGIIAKDYYDLNRCQYHNWQHILDCYQYLEQNSVAYSKDLDYAVLHHDIVYDQWPNKEARSAGFVTTKYPDVTGAIEPIMATVDHNIRGRSEIARWMIRADLHQLADLKLAAANYVKIMNESTDLYDIDLQTFARNNQQFMQGLKKTVINNYAEDNDQFWLDVLRGIDLTMQISSAMLSASSQQ
jgi:hypothetical protein